MNITSSFITAAQCRAARGFLNLPQSKLAIAAHIGPSTLSEFERGDRVPNYNNLQAIRAALETAGITFILENGGGPGVRLRTASREKAPEETEFSPDLCRAARNLLGLSQIDLADAGGVGLSTVADFERGARVPHPDNLTAIRAALEAAGVAFIDPNGGGGPGVRLRR